MTQKLFKLSKLPSQKKSNFNVKNEFEKGKNGPCYRNQ